MVNIIVFIVALVAGFITAVFAGEWSNLDDAVYGSMIAASVSVAMETIVPIIAM